MEGPLETMLEHDDPWVRSYFHGKRARTVVPKDENPHYAAKDSDGN